MLNYVNMKVSTNQKFESLEIIILKDDMKDHTVQGETNMFFKLDEKILV